MEFLQPNDLLTLNLECVLPDDRDSQGYRKIDLVDLASPVNTKNSVTFGWTKSSQHWLTSISQYQCQCSVSVCQPLSVTGEAHHYVDSHRPKVTANQQ